MAEELGVDRQKISYQCYKLGIKPIGKKEQLVQYLREMAPRCTFQELVQKTGMYGPYIQKLLYKHDIRVKAREPEVKYVTFRNVLSGFKRDDAGHYIHPDAKVDLNDTLGRTQIL